MNSNLGRAAAALLLPFLAAGCRPPRPQQVAVIKDELTRHFGNLNREAELRKLDLKTPRGGVYEPVSLGRQYSDYVWHPDLVIVVDVVCARCKTPQTVTDYRPGANPRVLCPRCGAGDDKAKEKSPPLLEAKLALEQLERKVGEKNVRKMFDLSAEGAAKEAVRGKVRFLRRQWIYDASGRVEVAGRGAEVGELLTSAPYDGEKVVDIDGRPTAPSLLPGARINPTMNNYYYGGYHRLDMTYVGEMEVEYDGGLKIVSEHEEPVRPWNLRLDPPPASK